MTIPALQSTLLPYTTLFRSDRFIERHAQLVGEHDRARVAASHLVAHIPPPLLAVDMNTQRTRRRRRKDRKSTRLNSSHVKISYAVFCLKKKKHTHTYKQAIP